MSQHIRILVLTLSTLLTLSCSHSSHSLTQRQVASQEIKPQVVEVIGEWISHPCRDIKGTPFRKYVAFRIDPETKLLYGRTSDSGTPVLIKATPKAGGNWGKVSDFFDEQGITAACKQDTNPTNPTQPAQPVPPTQPGKPDSKPPSNSKFVPPLNNPAQYYYAPFESAPNQERNILDRLAEFLNSSRIQSQDQADILVADCRSLDKPLLDHQVCVSPVQHDYKEARQKMMGDLDLRESKPGHYEVFDHYCQVWLGREEFIKAGVNTDFPGPQKIVHNRVMNCEHTWPQSKFTVSDKTKFGLMQKTDLHHIFTTHSKLNSKRSNFDFGEVDRSDSSKLKTADCYGKPAEAVLGPAAAVEGISQSSAPVFEPPAAHKGNVARALFYFAARYKAKMSKIQEHFLRKWHRQDPPDESEIRRNQRAYELSAVRNPFIDRPELVDQVESFSGPAK